MINFNTDVTVIGDLEFTGRLIGNVPVKISTDANNALIQKSTGLFVPVAPKGDTGIQGIKGDKGDKGDKGNSGAQGPAGSDGHIFGLGNGSTAFPNILNSTDFTGNRFLALSSSESPVLGNPMVGLSLQSSDTLSSQLFVSNNNGVLKVRARSVQNVDGVTTPGSWVTVYTDQEPPPQNAVDLSGYVPVTRTINGKNLRSSITLTADDISSYSKSTADSRYYIVGNSLNDAKATSITLQNSTVKNISLINNQLVLASGNGITIPQALSVGTVNSTGNIVENGVRVYSPNNPPPGNTKSVLNVPTPSSTVSVDSSTTQAVNITLNNTTPVQISVQSNSPVPNVLQELFFTVTHGVANSTVVFGSNVTFNTSEFKLKTTAGSRDFINLVSYDQGTTWYGYVLGSTSATASTENTIQVNNGFVVVGVPDDTPSTIPVTGVTLTPATFSLVQGKTQQLTATVAPSTATNKAVTYKSSNAAIATVSSTGLVTSVGVGSATITVTTTDGSFTKTSTCTVTAANVPVTSVTLTPATFDAQVGDTTQLVYTVLPSTATNKAVTFTSSDITIATVSSTGLVTSVGVGTATITVSTTDGSFTSSSTGAVSAAGLITGNMKTSGTMIVDKRGNKVKLKSCNWFGGESAVKLPHGIWQRSYKDIIDQIAGFGFNCVRLPFSGDTFKAGATPSGGIDTSQADNEDFILSGDPTKPATVVFKDTFTCFDYIINYMAEKNMYVILDHHTQFAGTPVDGSPISDNYTMQNWLDCWTSVASHYKSFPNVIGADVHNEPHNLDWNTWAGYAEQAGNAVLSVAPNWLIIVEGVGSYNSENYWWGGMMKGAASRPITLNVPNKVVYSPHEYAHSVGLQPWMSSDNNTVAGYPGNLDAVFDNAWGFIIKNNIGPVWVGEFGGYFGSKPDGSSAPNKVYEEQWLGELEKYITQNDVNWSYWCYNPNSGDTGGLVMSDWVTPEANKLSLLQPLLGA